MQDSAGQQDPTLQRHRESLISCCCALILNSGIAKPKLISVLSDCAERSVSAQHVRCFCCLLLRYRQAELVHARFAMLGAAGVLFPELLHGAGLGGPAAATPWFDAGRFNYFAPASALFGVQMLLFAWVEIRR